MLGVFVSWTQHKTHDYNALYILLAHIGHLVGRLSVPARYIIAIMLILGVFTNKHTRTHSHNTRARARRIFGGRLTGPVGSAIAVMLMISFFVLIVFYVLAMRRDKKRLKDDARLLGGT
jgi:hypothetical protein